jgi:cytochrome P450
MFTCDPESFKPQRWLNEDGKIRDDLKSPTFGFGRRCGLASATLKLTDVLSNRVCPGQHIAFA